MGPQIISLTEFILYIFMILPMKAIEFNLKTVEHIDVMNHYLKLKAHGS